MRVLVVEDDSLISSLLAELLDQEGYAVVQAGLGETALARPNEVDLHIHGHGPRESLAESQQHVRADDPDLQELSFVRTRKLDRAARYFRNRSSFKPVLKFDGRSVSFKFE